MDQQVILAKEQIELIILRLAHEIIESEDDLSSMAFIGIQPRGIPISDAIVKNIENISGHKINYGNLDITFHRDDIRQELRLPNRMHIPFSVENKKIILIDDVLYTGRTIRASLDAIQGFGRPSEVKLCIFINRRFGRELPIQPDYYGLSINTIHQQKVKVSANLDEVILYSWNWLALIFNATIH